MRELFLLSVALLLISAKQAAASNTEGAGIASAAVKSQALLVNDAGADPWIVEDQGVLYYTHTTGDDIRIWSGRTMGELAASSPDVVWGPNKAPPEARNNIWAPEIHFLQGSWYIYFAADDGRNENHRMFVLKSDAGPLGPYRLEGRLSLAGADFWAIDGTPLELNGQLYFIWSGWPGKRDGMQNLYIARMQSPSALSGERTLISTPEHRWESWINEGPAVLSRNGRTFLMYSANRSWTDDYRIGMLELTGSDPMAQGAWEKNPLPVFEGSRVNQIYGPGHCSFYFDMRTGEDWILYHTARFSGSGWDRHVRGQRFEWNARGVPEFLHPFPLGSAPQTEVRRIAELEAIGPQLSLSSEGPVEKCHRSGIF